MIEIVAIKFPNSLISCSCCGRKFQHLWKIRSSSPGITEVLYLCDQDKNGLITLLKDVDEANIRSASKYGFARTYKPKVRVRAKAIVSDSTTDSGTEKVESKEVHSQKAV